MNLKAPLLLIVLLVLFDAANAIETVDSFEELAEFHCKSFPIDILYRLSTGQVAEIYGKKYKDLDCYIRQFVNKGTNKPM